MKKIILFAFAAIIAVTAYSQEEDSTAAYFTNKNLPPINILQADSTWFTNTKLPKNKPIVVVYFSPECGHCQLAAQGIYEHKDELKNAFFVWVTFYSIPELKTFIKTYQIGKEKNFRFGRDPKYTIPAFYKVHFTPFMAVYDKNGQFVKAFPQGAEPEVLAKLVKENS